MPAPIPRASLLSPVVLDEAAMLNPWGHCWITACPAVLWLLRNRPHTLSDLSDVSAPGWGLTSRGDESSPGSIKGFWVLELADTLQTLSLEWL